MIRSPRHADQRPLPCWTAFTGPPGPLRISAPEPAEPLIDEDFQLALTVCYELHYRGLPGVDERWEWDPDLLAITRALEERFELALREQVRVPDVLPSGQIDVALRALAAADDGPSLSRHLQRDGTLAQYREFAAHRSIYQLKEADPHSFAIPRLHGAPKAALIRSKPTSTAAAGPTESTRRCSPRRCAHSGWTTATAPTSTTSPRSRSPPTT